MLALLLFAWLNRPFCSGLGGNCFFFVGLVLRTPRQFLHLLHSNLEYCHLHSILQALKMKRTQRIQRNQQTPLQLHQRNVSQRFRRNFSRHEIGVYPSFGVFDSLKVFNSETSPSLSAVVKLTSTVVIAFNAFTSPSKE